mmetsp:Transcript_5911/g.12948  ORF Transcript_5911/g.12948 Transcript_5911/m.12948 type:complete len:314 (-) Transcript_5911:336-1277(-)
MNWLRNDRTAAEAETRRDHLDIINRVKSNDPDLPALDIGVILNDLHTATLLAEALRGNTNLKRVRFYEYGGDMDHFHMVISALSETNVSKIIVVPWSQIYPREDDLYAVAAGKRLLTLQSNLTRLDLNACHIGPSGAIVLSALLANNTTLRALHLTKNDIGDEGAVAMAHMLKNKNRALKEMVLDNNGITAYGQLALRNAIYNDSSFEELEKSNHILQSYFDNPRCVFGKSVLNDVLLSHAANLRCKSEKSAVTKKLKRVLSKKYGVALRFESFLGTDAVMMPHVLGWAAQKCDLQMMYELKPLLFNLLEGGR